MKQERKQNILFSVGRSLRDRDRVTTCFSTKASLRQSSKSECAFLAIFRWMGLSSESENRVLLGVFCGLLVVSNVNGFTVIYVHSGTARLKLTLVHVIAYFLSTLVWCSLRTKRQHLSDLLKNVSKSQPFFCSKFQKLSFYLICSILFVIVSLDIVRQMVLKENYLYNLYGIQVSPYVGFPVFCFNSALNSFIYPTYVNLLCLMYSSLCLHLCRKLSFIASEVESCSASEFNYSRRQRDILRREAVINNLALSLQNVFSVASFLISTAHFSACIAFLGTLTVDSKIYAGDHVVLVQLILMFLSSSGGLLACLWVVGGFPLAEERLKDVFRRKMKQRFFLKEEDDEGYIWSEILEKPTFVLSGCDIIYFQRSSILSLAGTILTYTVLLISKN